MAARLLHSPADSSVPERISRVVGVDEAFDRFAALEPYFSVITDPRFLSAQLTDESRLAFLASGDAIVDALYRLVSRHLDTHFRPTALLEYGCGPGRLAVPLAERAAAHGGSVLAIDRSPSMLVHARSAVAQAGLTNVMFVDPSSFERGGERFDFITCYLVLQRLHPVDGLALVRRLVGRLLPGGVGAFQFPVRSRVTAATNLLRRLRGASPLIDRFVQRLRGNTTVAPFIPTHVYDLGRVMDVLRDAGLHAAHVVFDDHGDLDSVIVLATAPDIPRTSRADGSWREQMDDVPRVGEIDVRDVIRDHSIDVLNEAAEQYFASLATWDHHLAKPFASIAEAPALLADLSVVLRAADLSPGLTVLDFGAGTGWLSRIVTQLGCRALVVDVSPTALSMARALFARVPVVGDQPAPLFLHFDGRRLELADASVDRIICFHAFHHAANPDDVLAEFARVLKPGGTAAFAEPGARHSRSAKSQFEMKNYRVVENDVDVHHVWDVARHVGFASIRLFVSGGAPMDVSLADHDNLARGGDVGDVWLADTRRHLRNVSNFSLTKAGSQVADSRSTAGLACVLHALDAPNTVAEGASFGVRLRVTNTGSAHWLHPREGSGGVSVGWRLFSADGTLCRAEIVSNSFMDTPRGLQPGESAEVLVSLDGLAPGRYRVEFDCVAAGVTWFAQAGSPTAAVDIDVAASASR